MRKALAVKKAGNKTADAYAFETLEILRHWQQDVPNDRLAHLIRDVGRAQQRALQARLAPLGVSFGHWSYLRVLWSGDGLNQKDLSLRVGVMEPTTLAAVKAMELLGYVERRQIEGNRKNIHVFLTPKGRALEGELVPFAEEVNRLSLAGEKVKDVAQTRAFLMRMLRNLAQDIPTL